MSANRKLRRHIIPTKKFEAEIREGKKQVGDIYYEFRRRVLVEKPSQVQLRELIEECMARVKAKVTNDCVKLAYLRGFSIMLERVGGPIKSADDLYDEAVGDMKGQEGPTDESILQAMEMLGIECPPKGEL